MSEKLDLIKKFLNPEVVDFNELKTINSIAKLPISSFKFLNITDEALFKDLLNISNISELTTLDRRDPFKKVKKSRQKNTKLSKIIKKDLEFEEKVKKAITISLIIQRKLHESISKKHKDQKIIVVGLNNAGKTAILSEFGGRLGIKDLALLKPTKGVERKEIKTSELNLHIWDFGGQKDHRDEYLQAPENYFIGIDLIIYVIDIQDPQRYEESIEYFKKIIEIVVNLEESPYVLIFIHKFDPDINENDEVLLNVELVKDLVKSVFKNKKLDYDIYLSSIFSMISNEPKFSKFIKEVMSNSTSLTDPTTLKLSELGVIIEKSINAVIQLSSTMMTLEKRIVELETSKTEKPAKKGTEPPLPVPIYSKAPITIAPPPPPSALHAPPMAPEGLNLRTAVMTELKDIFVKKGISHKQE